MSGTSESFPDPKTMVDDLVGNWYNEYEHASMSDINNYDGSNQNG